jgi:hypothetical protein
MNKQVAPAELVTPKVTTGPLPASRKVYSVPEGAPDLRVPLREIVLSETSECRDRRREGSQARAHRVGQGARRRRGI